MKTITCTELAKNPDPVPGGVESNGEESIVKGNHRQVARIIPGLTHQTALEAISDLYRMLPAEVAADRLADSRL